MSLPTLATVADLEKRLGLEAGTLTGSDLMRAGVALQDASTLARAEAGTDWVADDGVTITAPAVVVTVVLMVARRAYSNPDSYSGESVGDYSYQVAREAQTVYLSAAERAIIRTAAGRAGSGVFSVRTPSAYSATHIAGGAFELP